MKLLIIGGTAFVGRGIVEYALARGHEVTLFTRGKTRPDSFPEAEHLTGDRDGNLTALEGRTWDAVIDTCGYVPRIVEQSASLLQNAAQHYTFISTISVYADLESPNINEASPLAQLEDKTTEEITGETYGGLKVLCDDVVRQYFPAKHLVVRPGLIVGPNDHTHRFAYWLLRTAEGGEMLAPGNPDQPMQIIDARDLGEWIIRMVEAQQTGTYNATGPAAPLPLKTILATAQEIAQSDTTFTWVADDFLLANGVQPWMSLPLWVPADAIGIHQVDVSKAKSAGLTFRPIAETIRDSYTWLEAEAAKPDSRPQVAHGSLPREKEAEILQAWHNRAD